MVLDLDETLIHSHHDGAMTITTPLTPPDFIVRVSQELCRCTVIVTDPLIPKLGQN